MDRLKVRKSGDNGAVYMSDYIPRPREWVAEQVKLYEESGGTDGLTLRDTGLPVIIVTYQGRSTGAIRKTPLMKVVDEGDYVLVGSQGGRPKHPLWYHNLKANPNVTIQDGKDTFMMQATEVTEPVERKRLWDLAILAYPPYEEYQNRTERVIPVFLAKLSG